MRKRIFVFTALATVGLGLLASWMLGTPLEARLGKQQSRARAAWVYKTNDVRQMVRDVDAIAVVRLAKVGRGRTAFSGIGENALDFELNEFALEEVLKAKASVGGLVAGGTLTLERVGTAQGQSGPVGLDHDGGAFETGPRYLLFLTKQPDSEFFVQVNDEGRYLIGPDNRLQSAGEGAVAAALRGRTLEYVRSLIREATGTP